MSILFDILAEVTKAGIKGAFNVAVGGTRMQPLGLFRPSRFGEPCSALVDRPSLQDRRDDPVYQKNLQRLIERSREFEGARKGKP